jgi:hypothetical protein
MPSRDRPAWRRVARRVSRDITRYVTSLGGSEYSSRGNSKWQLEHARREKSVWRRESQRVECFRFDDGYVATVTYEHDDVTWQLTPGPVTLGSALALVALYVEHGVTPQLDPSGRPFIAEGASGPVQVFDEAPNEAIDFVYLDGLRTIEEMPSFIDVPPNLSHVFDRMTPAEPRTLGNE